MCESGELELSLLTIHRNGSYVGNQLVSSLNSIVVDHMLKVLFSVEGDLGTVVKSELRSTDDQFTSSDIDVLGSEVKSSRTVILE